MLAMQGSGHVVPNRVIKRVALQELAFKAVPVYTLLFERADGPFDTIATLPSFMTDAARTLMRMGIRKSFFHKAIRQSACSTSHPCPGRVLPAST
ncbi:MAG: hypothetical protein LBL59_03425 [Xanthomonadaceae bacterium]|jgi:hypothetical protein|nr:hypothetical protein [Xanthomonadaceae bacterium]